MKNLFQVFPEDFFKPLISKYKQIYVDCILLLFNSFKPEISYGVNREIVVKALSSYFEADDDELSFDEVTYIRDAREKANAVIAFLKSCGWLEYEQEQNHQVNVVLYEYAVPVIEAMNRIIKEEEAEYQGIISQIHASLQNADLYSKPYELIIKGVIGTLEKYMAHTKKLTENDRKHLMSLIEKLNEADKETLLWEDYRGVLTFMLERDCKLEQEVVSMVANV